MTWGLIEPTLVRFLRRQQLYIAMAVMVYATFWALGQNANVIVTLVYSLLLCNAVALMQRPIEFLCAERPPLYFWMIYLVLLFAVSALAVLISTVPVFWIVGSRQSFWSFLATGWKFPYVATVIFGIATEIYGTTRCRLERRNRELQTAFDVQVAQRELQDEELNRAREIQQSLLPKEIPQVAGFEIAAAWEPARIVGGDYFDVIQLSETKVAICIADVVGKGVSAALLMANVQATVRAFASETAAPSWLCSRVNSVLCSNIAPDKFVTLFYGVLNAESGVLQYTNAGHLRPILIAESGRLTQLDDNGALLGVFPHWKYEDAVVHLATGDRLLLFTDGITEAASPDGEEFGEARLVEVARGLDGSCEKLNSHVLAQVKEFSHSQQMDDATLLVVAAIGSQVSADQEAAASRLARV